MLRNYKNQHSLAKIGKKKREIPKLTFSLNGNSNFASLRTTFHYALKENVTVKTQFELLMSISQSIALFFYSWDFFVDPFHVHKTLV